MPYLQPEVALDRIAGFTRNEIRSGIKDDREFLQSQAGSMSSTLRFLAREIEYREEAIAHQRAVLDDALTTVATDASEMGAEAVREAASDASSSLEGLETMDVYAVEQELLDAANDVLAVIDGSVDDEQACRLREPLYEFIECRLDEQLKMLGRDEE